MRTIQFGRSAIIFILFIIIPSGSLIRGEEYLYPQNKVLKFYQSPKFNSYQIKKIAVAPMMNDDSTETGTLYSTNHFINGLERNFKRLKFCIPDVTGSADPDSLIPWMAESIEKLKHLDLKNFFETDLGFETRKENADAIFIGLVKNVSTKSGNSYSISENKFYKATLTSCEFTYYLISLRDGRVLLRIDTLGEEGYFLLGNSVKYPGIDMAISNGIDKILETLPFR